MGQAVVAVYDGSDAARGGLSLATQIAHDESTPLVIVFPTTGDRAAQLKLSAQSDLDGLGVDRSVRFRTVLHPHAALLGDVVRGEDAGILILPTADVFEKGFQELLTELECPLLVVQQQSGKAELKLTIDP